jgi:hypothetical protein
MRTVSLAALCAAALLGGAVVSQTADAATSHGSHGAAGKAGTSHTSHGSHSSHSGSANGSGSSANGGDGSNSAGDGISTANGINNCTALSAIPVVGGMPLPAPPDPTGVLGSVPDPTGLAGSLGGGALNNPVANLSPSIITGIVTGSLCTQGQ